MAPCRMTNNNGNSAKIHHRVLCCINLTIVVSIIIEYNEKNMRIGFHIILLFLF